MRIGLVINPVAGMGGAIGLKGSDGIDVNYALAKGGRFVAEQRARDALSNVEELDHHKFLTASGKMGEYVLKDLGIEYDIVHTVTDKSTARDTIESVRSFVDAKVDLIIFCGGDGTAADVLAGSPGGIVCIGIPSGVKMHSAVFANTPFEAGELISHFLKGGMATKEAEVMDIDEVAFRRGELRAVLLGHLIVPDDSELIQPPKGTVAASSDEEEKDELGEEFASSMDKDILYVIGPGTTCAALAKAIGVEKTLLGVDVVKDGAIVAQDVDESTLLSIISKEKKVKVVVTPIGRQGFIFGRGNQQISAEVLRHVDRDDVVVYATPSKLHGLDRLRVDTGDFEVDASFKGYQKVRVGFGRQRVMKVE